MLQLLVQGQALATSGMVAFKAQTILKTTARSSKAWYTTIPPCKKMKNRVLSFHNLTSWHSVCGHTVICMCHHSAQKYATMRIGSTSLHVNFPSLSSPRGNNQRCTILVNETLAKPIEVPNCLRCQHPWRLENPQVIYFQRSFWVFRDRECLTFEVWNEIPWWFWFVHYMQSLLKPDWLFPILLVEPFFFICKGGVLQHWVRLRQDAHQWQTLQLLSLSFLLSPSQ